MSAPQGKTLLDEFAMAALTGLLAQSKDYPDESELVGKAYRIADWMAAEREEYDH